MKNTKKNPATVVTGFSLWRKRWDSNPRAREDYLISSQARYDHFDTLPYIRRRGTLPGAVDSIADGAGKCKRELKRGVRSESFEF